MILDIVVVLFVLVAVVIGYKVGFIKIVLKLAGIITGFITSLMLSKPLSEFLVTTSLGNNLVARIQDNISSKIGVVSDMSIAEVLEEIGFPSFFSFLFNDLAPNGDVVAHVSEGFSLLILQVISFLLLFVGLVIIFFILRQIANILRVNGIIKFVDGVIGIVLAVFLFFLLSSIVLSFIEVLIRIDVFSESLNPFMSEQLESSHGIYRYLYDHNVLKNFVDLFIKV